MKIMTLATWSKVDPQLPLFLVAGTTTSLGLMYPLLWFLTPLGFGIHLFALIAHTKTPRTAFIMSWMFGLVTTAAALAWFWHMPPFDWMGSPSYIQGAYFAGSIWVLTSLLLGLSCGLFGITVWYCRHSSTLPYITPFLYTLSAEMSMWLHTLIASGKASLFEPHFSVPSFGYTLTEQPYLLQLAHPSGISGLNFATALLAIAIAISIRALSNRDAKKYREMVLAVVAAFLLLATPMIAEQHNPSRVKKDLQVLVFSLTSDLNVGKNAYFEKEISTTLSSQIIKPDIVVLPESNSITYLLGDTAERMRKYKEWFGDKEALVVYTSYKNEGSLFNALYFENTHTGTAHEQKKRYLAPEGEYTTYLGHAIFALIHNKFLDTFSTRNTRKHDLTPGPTATGAPFRDFTVGGLTCYEIFSPTLYHNLVKNERATLLINTSDPTWFHGSKLLFNKTMQMARLHAVQNRVPFLGANKGTESYVIDARGVTVARTPWNTTNFIMTPITIYSEGVQQ